MKKNQNEYDYYTSKTTPTTMFNQTTARNKPTVVACVL